MSEYEFKVNGETLFSDEQEVDARELLRIAFIGKAIGEDPDSTRFVLRVPDSNVTFVAGELVDLGEYKVFSAAPGFEFKVNGEPFFADEREVDAAVLLRIAFNGKAIGKDPDQTGYVLRFVQDASVTFVAGQIVDLGQYSVFRAAPDKGAPFA